MNTKSSRMISLVAMLLLAGALLTACGTGAAPSASDVGASRTITVVGYGEAIGRPDQAEAQVGVETFAETVDEATTENETNVRAVMAALLNQGIAQEDIQTSNYNLWAEQNYDQFGPTGIVGYHVTNQVNVTIHDTDAVGAVLGAATEAGANSIYGVYFTLSEPGALEAEARAAAMVNARERAETLAGLGDVTLGEVLAISELIGQPAPFVGMGGGAELAASAAPSIAPGQLSYSVQIQVTFAIK